LYAAYDFFNKRLLEQKLGKMLPDSCMITMQRRASTRGYYSPGNMVNMEDDDEGADEIALNPKLFATRSATEVLSTFVHEMVHKWQQQFGTPSKRRYHNREWADLMIAVGLIPSRDGRPGGKQTGACVTHYIEQGGAFEVACAEFIAKHGTVLYRDKIGESQEGARKRASKTKYTCKNCGANAWGCPTLNVNCGDCDNMKMEPESPEDGNGEADGNGAANGVTFRYSEL
jgi:predicted SprT family Zn-dependent metalloprotease